MGLGKGAIDGRVARFQLHRVHRGVYRVGHTAPLPFAREMAALLAHGDHAVLSHRSAAAAWGLAREDDGEVSVTVPPGGCRQRPGVRVHRSSLAPEDVRRLQGIPLTSPARTLLDLAGLVDLGHAAKWREGGRREAGPLLLERALEDARRRRLVTRRSLLAALERAPRRKGSAALRELLRRERGPALTRSAAERRLLELVRRARIPEPDFNLRVGSYELDAAWQDAGLVVEIDGYKFHSGRAAFERDRERDAVLAAAGWQVIRVTWRQLTEEPEAVVARLAGALTVSSCGHPARRSDGIGAIQAPRRPRPLRGPAGGRGLVGRPQ
jgi:very-short-patch-repair endonuclease